MIECGGRKDVEMSTRGKGAPEENDLRGKLHSKSAKMLSREEKNGSISTPQRGERYGGGAAKEEQASLGGELL